MKIFNIKMDDEMWNYVQREATRLHTHKSEILKRLLVQDMIEHDQNKTLNDLLEGKAPMVDTGGKKRW